MSNACIIENMFDSAIVLTENAMLKHRSDLFIEWDFDKNNLISLDIYKVTKGSVKKANWICNKCNSEFESRIDSRIRGSNCPYCSGQRVNHTNSLASLNPQLALQWHVNKNRFITPHDVTCNSEKKVWWLCAKNHSYECRISDRNKNKSCPYCANKQIIIGSNDLWTTHPDVAKLLLNPEEGYKYSFGSNKKINFKCPDCNHIIKSKNLNKVCTRGLSCPSCSDGYSYPEKLVYGLLSQLGIEFKPQKIFDWGKDKKYDFYIHDLNMIIETHGRQHIEEGFQITGARTIAEEKENDKHKRELAISNGVKYYIELDCYHSDLAYIKSSILNSEISTHFDLRNTDWEIISLNAIKSRLIEVCEFYNNNAITQKEMSAILNISDSTIRDYLRVGSELGLCEYTPNSQNNKMISVRHMERKIVQLSLNGKVVNQWDSIRLAGRSLGKESSSSISACCTGKAKTAYGFKWMYLEDYEGMIKNQTI